MDGVASDVCFAFFAGPCGDEEGDGESLRELGPCAIVAVRERTITIWRVSWSAAACTALTASASSGLLKSRVLIILSYNRPSAKESGSRIS